MPGIFRKKELTLPEQLAIVEPVPKQTGYKDRYRSEKDPLRIGKEFRQLTVFPPDFWQGIEAFYEQNYGSVADVDMDPYITRFFASFAEAGQSLDEWEVVLLAIRNFYRLHVWSSQQVTQPGADSLGPALQVLCVKQRADYVSLVQFTAEHGVMSCLGSHGVWEIAWAVAQSSGEESSLMRQLAEGYAESARASGTKAYYLGRAALLCAKSGDSGRARELFAEALRYANADERAFVALKMGRVVETFSPGERDAREVLKLAAEAGLVRDVQE